MRGCLSRMGPPRRLLHAHAVWSVGALDEWKCLERAQDGGRGECTLSLWAHAKHRKAIIDCDGYGSVRQTISVEAWYIVFFDMKGKVL